MKEDRLVSFLLSAFFLLGLFLPGLFLGEETQSANEKRHMAKAPTLEWNWDSVQKYPKSFEEYSNDQFGFRQELVQLNNRLHRVLYSSTKDVVFGKDGWLYAKKNRDFRNAIRFSGEHLENWRHNLEAKYDWLQSRGIDYLFVVAPDKHTIYPEYLPSSYSQIRQESSTTQFVAYMQANSKVPILDLRPLLLEKKVIGRLYYKTDTHWNFLGASIAQNEIMKTVKNRFPEVSYKFYTSSDFIWKDTNGGDLARMLSLQDELPELKAWPAEDFDSCVRKWHYFGEPPPKKSFRDAFYTICNKGNKKNALIIGDSFFEKMQGFLAQYFKVATKAPPLIRADEYFLSFQNLVQTKNYDIVIEEQVERALSEKPPLPDE